MPFPIKNETKNIKRNRNNDESRSNTSRSITFLADNLPNRNWPRYQRVSTYFPSSEVQKKPNKQLDIVERERAPRNWSIDSGLVNYLPGGEGDQEEKNFF